MDDAARREIDERRRAQGPLDPGVRPGSASSTGCSNMDDWMISKKRYWGLALPIYDCQPAALRGDRLARTS